MTKEEEPTPSEAIEELRSRLKRLRAANKKLLEMLMETPCETNGTTVEECVKSKSCCCAIEDYASSDGTLI